MSDQVALSDPNARAKLKLERHTFPSDTTRHSTWSSPEKTRRILITLMENSFQNLKR
ncbi:MAG: hypothetical protein Q9173_003788 [Seirophora scorigena]